MNVYFGYWNSIKSFEVTLYCILILSHCLTMPDKGVNTYLLSKSFKLPPNNFTRLTRRLVRTNAYSLLQQIRVNTPCLLADYSLRHGISCELFPNQTHHQQILHIFMSTADELFYHPWLVSWPKFTLSASV